MYVIELLDWGGYRGEQRLWIEGFEKACRYDREIVGVEFVKLEMHLGYSS